MRALIVLITVLLLSCNGFKKVKEVFQSNTPYEEYKNLLEKAELEKTAIAQQWIEAGENALRDSLFISLPHSEAGYFHASAPDAHAYRFQVKSGQKLKVSLDATKDDNASLFADLFELDNNEWKQVAHGDSSSNLEHEFKKDQNCLLRLQPELLVDIYYTVTLTASPTLINPVSGASNRSIQSIFGDPRDGGLRSHEGIDIFADRGTPVIAPAKGIVTRVGSSNLGGNVVWMKDLKRNLNYYFAHLDRQLVNVGKVVSKGDTLGLVGNSGNAKYTAPHLHFGIYQYGAVNPLGYVQTIDNDIESIIIDSTTLGHPYKVISQMVNFRKGPGTQHEVHRKLNADTYLTISGECKDWYRAQLPDQQEGYIFKSLVTPITVGTEITLQETVTIFSSPDSTGIPKRHLVPPYQVESLASYNGFKYVRISQNSTGWIDTGLISLQKGTKR